MERIVSSVYDSIKRSIAVYIAVVIVSTAFLPFLCNVNAIVFFEDDMESGPDGWTSDGLWHMTEYRFHSEECSWAYNNEESYDTGDRNMGNLTSPVIDLTSATFSNLTFWTWYDTQGGMTYDQMWIQISENGGAFVNEYQIDPKTMGTWLKISVNITSHVGNNIQVRFFFDTIDDNDNKYEGWFIDDVEVNDVPIPPPPSFEPTHSDYGLDTNDDGLFNYLVVNATVNIHFPGTYIVNGDLYGLSPIDSDYNQTFLDVGIQIVKLYFVGWRINLSSENGPYTVELNIFDSSWNWFNSSTHITESYNWDQFQGPPELRPMHSDFGLDTDFDNFFNYLVVNVSINVTTAGNYGVIGELFNQSGSQWITYTKNSSFLDIGVQIIQLNFSGTDIFNSGIDGPYWVELELDDDEGYTLDNDIYITGSYKYDQFQPPAARFEPPHSDYGLDTDSDSFFNYLIVNVTVNVTEAGNYRINGELRDSTWDEIEYDSNSTFLDTGIHIVKLRFDGWKVHINRFNGTYNVTMDIYVIEGEKWTNLDSDTHETNYYEWDEFQPPPGKFEPPHSDHGLDTNGDTLFDYLVVNATVNISEAGNYVVIGVLFNSYWEDIDYDDNQTYLDIGIHIVKLRFEGYRIYNNGENGTFNVTLDLIKFEGDEEYLDSDEHETKHYTWDQFQPPPARFEPPHSDYALDMDFNALYDYLIVNVSVNVSEAGDYRVSGTLIDSGWDWIDQDYNYTFLDTGTQIVELHYPGWFIRDHGEDGPFFVELRIYLNERGLLDLDTHLTNSYLWDKFETPPAEFFPPHSDYGLDMNDDNFYDYLVVQVKVNVSKSGTYIVEGDLYEDPRDWNIFTSTTEYLYAGIQTVELGFEGWEIYDYGYNGSYTIELELYMENERDYFLDEDTHTTQDYDYDEFTSTPPASFAPPYSDDGLDVNGDTYDDYLVVDVPIDVSIESNYAVVALLYNVTGEENETEIIEISTYIHIAYLETGTQTVQLFFDGVDINQSGIDGPYYIHMELIFQGFQENWDSVDEDTHITEPYTCAMFATTDPVPPQVSSTIPMDGKENVPIHTMIWIAFSEAMNTTSVEETFSFTDGFNTWTSFDGEWVWMANLGVFMPDDPLSYSTTYTATIEASIAKDTTDNFLDGDGDGNAEGSPWDDYEWTFHTGDAPPFSELDVAGTNKAPTNVYQGDTDIVMEQLTLSAVNGAVNVISLKVDLSGTGTDSDITAVRLYHDADGSGTLDGGDSQLGTTQSFSGGTLTFSGLWFIVNPGTPENLLIVYDISVTATIGATVGCTIVGDAYITVQAPGIVNSFATIQSVNSNIQDFTDYLTIMGEDEAPTNVIQGQIDVVMEKLTLIAGTDSLTLTAIKLDKAGTAMETEITSVKLFDDSDDTGTFTGGDIQLGTTQTFSGGTLTFSGLSYEVNSGTSETLFILYDISDVATVGDTVGGKIVDSSYITLLSPDAVNAFGLINSTNSTIQGSSPDALTVAGLDKAPTNVMQGQTDIVMEQLTFTAGSGTIKITDIDVDLSGTGSDSDIAAVKLYHDADKSGTITGVDVQLGTTQTFVGRTLTFSDLSLIVNSGSPEKLLILFDILALASEGVTVGCTIVDNTYITVDTPDMINAFTELQSTNSLITADIVSPTIISIVMSDPSPTKAGNVTFIITFNEDMDIGVDPTVAIGESAPYDAYEIDQLSFEGDTWTGYFVIDTNTGDGKYNISVGGAQDQVGNPMEINTSFTFVIDTIAPTSSANTLSQYQNSSTFDIPYTDHDGAGSGVAYVELYYRRDGGDWVKYGTAFTSSPISFLAPADGFFEFYTIATDNADNTEIASIPPVADASTTVDTTKPTILSIELSDPSPTKEGVVTFIITFSEIVNTTVDLIVTFGKTSPYDTYTITQTLYSENVWTGTFTIDTTTGDGTYTISVSGAEDLVGHQMISDTSHTFVIDTTSPTKVDNTPTGTDIPVTTTISVTFNEAMDTASVENAFSFSDGTNTWTISDGSASWSDNTMIFTPDSELNYNTQYTVTVRTEAKDLAGNTPSSSYTWSFTTIAHEPDTIPPTVVSTSLIGKDVEVTNKLTITFSEPMDRTSVENSISVSPDMKISGFQWDGNNLTITFSSYLKPDTEYTVNIGTGAKDSSGNALEEPHVVDFSTKSKPDDGFIANYWWIILIAAIAIVALLTMLLKRGKSEEELPRETKEESKSQKSKKEELTEDIEEENEPEEETEETS